MSTPTISPAPQSKTATASVDRVLEAAERLIPTLRARAAEADDLRRVSEETYADLVNAGLLDVLKPKEFGGLELDDHAHAMVALTLARGCASTAWIFSILNSDNTAILAFPREAHEEVWGPNRHASLAGNLNLNPKATARAVDGGFVVSGTWGFCSGSDFSEWLVFNAPAGDRGEGHLFLVPQGEATVIDDWFPTGMRGSGSRSMKIEEVFVPGYRALPISGFGSGFSASRELYPTFDALYGDWPPHGRFPFASVAAGAALGAVEHFAETAATSTRAATSLGGRLSLVDQDYVATEFMDAAGDADTAAMLVAGTSLAASSRARAHRAATEQEIARIQRDNALVARASVRSVNRIFSLIGSRAGSPAHPVSIAKRDIEMISHHVSVNWRQAATRYLKSLA